MSIHGANHVPEGIIEADGLDSDCVRVILSDILHFYSFHCGDYFYRHKQ